MDLARFNPVIGRRGPGQQDQTLFDLWSLVHILTGLLMWKIGLDANVAIMLIIVAEGLENTGFGVAFFNWLGRIVPKGTPIIKHLFESQAVYEGDSVGNMVADVFLGIGAYALAYFAIIPLGAVWF